MGQGMTKCISHKVLGDVDWLSIDHTSKTKLADYTIFQNVLLISGMDYMLPTSLMSSLTMYVSLAMKWAEVMCVFS